MVAVKHCYSFWILSKKVRDLEADVKQEVKSGASVIFPVEALDILEFFLVNFSATQVYSDVLVVVIF